MYGFTPVFDTSAAGAMAANMNSPDGRASAPPPPPFVAAPAGARPAPPVAAPARSFWRRILGRRSGPADKRAL